MTRSAAIAAAYMLAVSQGGAMLRAGKTYGPADYLRPRHVTRLRANRNGAAGAGWRGRS